VSTGIAKPFKSAEVAVSPRWNTPDQSYLNRWITEVEWEPEALNKRRLDLSQRDSATRYTKHGVIAIDNTLIDHDGKLIADVGWFWDHADQRHLIAHDYLIANYVCASGKHYPSLAAEY